MGKIYRNYSLATEKRIKTLQEKKLELREQIYEYTFLGTVSYIFSEGELSFVLRYSFYSWWSIGFIMGVLDGYGL